MTNITESFLTALIDEACALAVRHGFERSDDFYAGWVFHSEPMGIAEAVVFCTEGRPYVLGVEVVKRGSHSDSLVEIDAEKIFYDGTVFDPRAFFLNDVEDAIAVAKRRVEALTERA